jgi:hypothetical protein
VGVLLKRLIAATGEASTSSLLGQWRLAVSRLLDDILILPWPGSLSCGPVLNGAVREITPAGALFPTNETWYRDATKTVVLLDLVYIRDPSGKPTQLIWLIYSLNGVLVATVTDTITYSGLYEIQRVRTVT